MSDKIEVPTKPTLKELANAVADKLEADIIFYNGGILRHYDTQLIRRCRNRRKRKNVVLILVTTGGSADPAYRIARFLQVEYTRFYLLVSGCCKSAGTLVATGAHEIIMSDYGELGPLDVQMTKKDELWETQSGLTVMDTLTALRENAFNAFERFFLKIKRKSDDQITSKMATEIATQMTTGLFTALYRQVDPMHIGEAARAMSIASHYGDRLLKTGCNIEVDALKFLTSMYPSHGFVIDRNEAQSLFNHVREPIPEETLLLEELGEEAIWPIDDMEASIGFLSTEPPMIQGEETGEKEGKGKGEGDESEPRIPPRAGSRRINRTAREKPRNSNVKGNVTEFATVSKNRDGKHYPMRRQP